MYQNFLGTFGEAFARSFRDFQVNRVSLSLGDESFASGYMMGLHRVFTLLEQTADQYGISLQELGLGELNEEDFLS